MTDDRAAQAERALAQYLSQLDADPDASFSAFLLQHADIAHDLRKLYDRWMSVSGLLSALGAEKSAGSGESPSQTSAPRASGATRSQAGNSGEYDASDPRQVLSGLAARRADFAARYEVLGEVARGGMGLVLSVRDKELRRRLAMKVIRTSRGSGANPVADEQLVARFLEEAQVTSQLDHPGVLPVHDLGLDDSGRVYFTMPLVDGQTLGEVFEKVGSAAEGWTRVRALGVILRVCETVASAHERGVVHRDLKPANIMVGRFGETYVMDWGLARVQGAREAASDPLSSSAVASVRSDASGAHGSSALNTVDGAVLGTPSYMPPEQARGEELDGRADVYSIGAILYELLAGAAPYRTGELKERQRTPRAILNALREGPPEVLARCVPDVNPELEAICVRAMERQPDARYSDPLALAEDLRAFLEGRVVAAHQVGPVPELRKWVLRNRALALAVAAGVLVTFAGLAAIGYVQTQGKRAAEVQSERADRRTEDVLSLSASQDLEELVARADELWPAHPALLPEYETWLEDAEGMIARLGEHRERLVRVGDSSSDVPEGELGPVTRRWWQSQLSEFIAELEALRDAKTGLMEGVSADKGWGVRRRLAFARRVGAESVESAEVASKWNAVVAGIQDVAKSPQYGGLTIEPQMGLLPLGQDPTSGLWEFAHLQTGVPAVRGANGELSIGPETGLVLTLVPAGEFWMGAQSESAGAGFDLLAQRGEQPVVQVTLAPFFISKYEMTQGQWTRATGENPSFYRAGREWYGNATTLANPVEHVSWFDCQRVLGWLDLQLPTEAQWEYASRAGTVHAWWTGASVDGLDAAGNIADSYARSNGGGIWPGVERALNDGHTSHAPVGSFAPNPFGLHDTIGNLWEWCQDVYASYTETPNAGDGQRGSTDAGPRLNRGGSFIFTSTAARSATRMPNSPETRSFNVGVRPARRLVTGS